MQAERPDPSAELRRLDPVQPEAELRVRSSVERGRGPSPGTFVKPFFWGDVVHSPPPRRKGKGEGAYVLYHGTETELDARVTYSTIVAVDPGVDKDDPNDDVMHVDSRIGVQRRLLFEAIDRERAFMERTSAHMRERLIRGLVRQRRAVNHIPSKWARKPALAAIRLQGRAGLWSIRAMQRSADATVQVPDTIFSQLLRVWGHVRARVGRQGLWAGMRDPRSLTTEQKGVVLFLSTCMLLATVFILNNTVPILFPESAETYRTLLTTFLLGVATAVLLPFPPSELLVVPPYFSAGPAPALITIVLSKLVGAWLVFFVGDALNTLIAQRTEGRPRLTRWVDWSKRNSERYGFYLLSVFLTAPFLPDTLALYVFAVSGTRFKAFLAAALVGSTVRYAGVIAVLSMYGEAFLRSLL